MNHHTTPLDFELVSTGGSKTIEVTPGASVNQGKFVISGIPAHVQDMRNYMTRFYPHIQTTLDTDGGGNAVSWDKLSKICDSVEIISPTMGVMYPHFHTQGAALGQIIGFVANAYQYQQGARTQIPANTDADYTVDMYYHVPVANECLADPMETAQWTGFFDGGTVEIGLAASTVLDGDYAGAVLKAPTTLRCLAETIPSSREYIGVPFQWRRRTIAGGGSSPLLKNVGGETSLNGIAPGAGLAGLYWLTNATGIGLGGNDGVDNISAITLDWRGQKNIQNLDGFFHWARIAQEKRGGPISQGAGSALLDGATWPHAMDSVNEGRPSADPLSYCLPIITPGRKLHTSKVQRVLGDLQVDFTSAVAFTAQHEFLSFELLEFSASQFEVMRQLGNFRGEANRASLTGKAGTESNHRYTAIEFV